MVRMSNDDKRKNKDYGDSSQLTNWILDLGATCHMCLDISSLQTEYLNIDNSNSGSSKQNVKANSAKTKCTYCGLSNHSVEKISKRSEKKKRKLVLLVLRLTKIQIV